MPALKALSPAPIVDCAPFQLICTEAGRSAAGLVGTVQWVNGSVQRIQLVKFAVPGDQDDFIAKASKDSGLDDATIRQKLLILVNAIEGALRSLGTAAKPLSAVKPSSATPAWMDDLSRTRDGTPHETLGNVTLALQHLDPWATTCWYDAVRDLPMIGDEELSDPIVTRAGLDIEAETGMHVRSIKLLAIALTHLCHQRPRDLLREWIESLAPWDKKPRLDTWLTTYAHATETAVNRDMSRLMLVSMVARVLDPGCQYRYVITLEGPENAGKSKLVKALSGPEWYREISHGLEGKESHMRIKRAWVAELAELSSFTKTEESRLKSFFTLQEDTYIPKFSNFEVTHKRRTIFLGTNNPEGDNTILRNQTGNTRYLFVPVCDINIEGFQHVRDDLFAEALAYYRAHPKDWWKLSKHGEAQAIELREDRRQRSAYEESLGNWLEEQRCCDTWIQIMGSPITWWEDIAENYLQFKQRGQWDNHRATMDIAKAMKALGWPREKRQTVNGAGFVRPWRAPNNWRETP